VRYNIEIKSSPKGDGVYHPAPAEFSELVMDVIRTYGLETYSNIQSFDVRPLQYLHGKYPDFPLALLIDGNDPRNLDQQIRDLGFTPAFYSPNYARVDAALVREVHERGMKIVPWTVNDKETIEKLRNLGVDGIITDYPDLFY
jgi:glycerophosphoryl diester phosphodiesterase